MPTISVNLHEHDVAPSAYVLTTSNDGRFIVLNLAPDVSFYMPGFDATCIAAARALAATLLKAADELDAALLARQPADDSEDVPTESLRDA